MTAIYYHHVSFKHTPSIFKRNFLNIFLVKLKLEIIDFHLYKFLIIFCKNLKYLFLVSEFLFLIFINIF